VTTPELLPQPQPGWNRVGSRAGRLVLFVLMIYLFLAAIELFGGAMKLAGHDTAQRLFHGLSNPFAGLAVGILATALVQSSSVTTSTVVAMVGAGKLPLAHAVPIVMGANIGTSVTCMLVSLGHITHSPSFRRAFAGATMHDMFNLLAVLVFFPLELATGFLRRTACWLVTVLPWGDQSGTFHSPVKSAVKWLAHRIQGLVAWVSGLEGGWLAAVLCGLAFAMIVVSLVTITRNMRILIADRIEHWLNRVLLRSGLLGLAIGALITALVQSSSITTSLLVPMYGAGVLKLEAGFPLTLGANIGTTITALLASTVTGPAGLTIAVVHLLFNVCGTLLVMPVRYVRHVPIRLAEKLADLTIRNKIWALVYIGLVFFLLPLAGILIWE